MIGFSAEGRPCPPSKETLDHKNPIQKGKRQMRTEMISTTKRRYTGASGFPWLLRWKGEGEGGGQGGFYYYTVKLKRVSLGRKERWLKVCFSLGEGR